MIIKLVTAIAILVMLCSYSTFIDIASYGVMLYKLNVIEVTLALHYGRVYGIIRASVGSNGEQDLKECTLNIM